MATPTATWASGDPQWRSLVQGQHEEQGDAHGHQRAHQGAAQDAVDRANSVPERRGCLGHGRDPSRWRG